MSLPGTQFTLLQEAVDMEGIGLVTWIILLAIILVQIAAWWKMFEKAGKPGWAAIVPIYNIFVLIQIAGKPGWWIILCLIPIVNIIVMLLVSIGVANNFGKGTLFGIGLFLLGFIFYPILGFGDDHYGAATGQP
ncbi:MAG: DUF5684 domain-containing protein [Gemmatimonadaceae bacterium]